MLTPDELRQIRRLHLQLNRRVDSPFAGEYRSAFRGQGMEFEEVRPYVPGDDIRHIDWNVTARAGQPFIKLFREERELTVLIVLDLSASVRFGAGGRDGRTDKRLQIARLAGAIAWAAVRNGDRVGLLGFSDQIEQFLPPRKSRGHAWSVVRACFAEGTGGRGTDLGGALERAGQVLKRRAVVCLFSDFLQNAPEGRTHWQRQLAILARRHSVSAFLVHDPLEAAMPDVGLVTLEDAETGRPYLVDARTLRSAFSPEARLKELHRVGVRATPVSTSDDPFAQLLWHFRRMEHLR